jgi:hypothetical protein
MEWISVSGGEVKTYELPQPVTACLALALLIFLVLVLGNGGGPRDKH